MVVSGLKIRVKLTKLKEFDIKLSQTKKVLYIAPFSQKLLGAEESDIRSGVQILQTFKKIYIYTAFINLESGQIYFNDQSATQLLKSSLLDRVNFYMHYFSSPDYTLRQGFTFKNFLIIKNLCKNLNINIVITNTTSTFLFGRQKKIRHVHRSVAFEPVYCLKAVSNPVKAFFHSIVKILTVFKELQAHTILSISPRDKKYYSFAKKIFFKRTHLMVMPLRQFYYSNKVKHNLDLTSDLKIAFLGSTYNVLHNKKSLYFILQSIDFNFLSINKFTLNLYGSKFPSNIETSQNIIINSWIDNINEVYEVNHCFLVPYFLNSGMQSKVFEPLIMGRILICDTRSISGYDFEPFEHFIPAKNELDFRNGLKWIIENPNRALKIAENARIRASEIIGKQAIVEQTRKCLTFY